VDKIDTKYNYGHVRQFDAIKNGIEAHVFLFGDVPSFDRKCDPQARFTARLFVSNAAICVHSEQHIYLRCKYLKNSCGNGTYTLKTKAGSVHTIRVQRF
jgi:hypothetical protein